jgi:hypothetical protein
MARTDPQVNLRLPREVFDVLEAAAFVHRVSPSALLTEVAEEAIDDLRREKPVEAALSARAEADRGSAEKVQRLPRNG